MNRWAVAVACLLALIVGLIPGAETGYSAGKALTPIFLGSLTYGPDGNLWFFERTGIGRMTQDGHVTHFRLPLEPDAYNNIVAGPDQSIWYANGATLGRITTSGHVTRFHIALPQAEVLGVALGPDSQIWFTAGSPTAGWIGTISDSGHITTHPVPLEHDQLSLGLVTGPDAAMWFLSDDHLMRSTLRGDVTRYHISPISPGMSTAPISIAVGQDRQLWFTEMIGGSIMHAALHGAMTRHEVATKGGPWHIAAGPHDSMWFTMLYDNRVGRIGMDGQVRFLTLPTANSGPVGITASPDGGVWLTATCINALIHIAANGRVTELPVDGQLYPAPEYCMEPI